MSNDQQHQDTITKTTFAMKDEVWHRVVQIVQEALLTGVDCSDLLRQVRVQESKSGSELELTPEYVQQVKEGYDRMVAEVTARRNADSVAKIIKGS